MDRTRSMYLQAFEVGGRPIPFVLIKFVLWIYAVPIFHHTVARDLRNHACGRNTHRFSVSTHDSGLRLRETRDRQPINQEMFRLRGKRRDRSLHRQESGAQYIQPVDLYWIRNANGVTDECSGTG